MNSDLLVRGIGELVTNRPGAADVVGVVRDAAVAIRSGRVAWVGSEVDVPSKFRDLPELPAEGRAAMPGFVDAHTHLVFAGDRADEFTRRLRGETYGDMLASGGGIHATVRATREATLEELVATGVQRANRMLRHGTTTVEVKSGYGLDTETEVRMLQAARAIGEKTPIDVVPTFMGAHVLPTGADRDEYVRLVVEEMLPACAPLAVACDVFCDQGAFTVGEARRVLEAGREHGLRPRLHADQLAHTGAAQLAAELRAASADHLDHITPEDAVALKDSGTVAVLLPGASFSLRLPQAPARMIWDTGVTMALGTDCNPGTSYIESMPLVVAIACLEMGLTAEEAVWAATRGGALALGDSDKGWLGEGTVADVVLLDAPSYLHLAYRPGSDLVWKAVKAGEILL